MAQKRKYVSDPIKHRRCWRVKFSDKYVRETGQRSWRSFSPDDYEDPEAEAWKFVNIVRERADAGYYTIGQAITDFIAEKKMRGRKPRTLESYKERFMRVFVGEDLDLGVSDIDEALARELWDAYVSRPTRQTGEPPSGATLSGIKINLSTLWRWLRKKKFVEVDVWEEIEILAPINSGKPTLRADEAKKLLTACVMRPKERGALGVAIALTMGLRASEVVGIMPRDIDSEGTILHVQGTKTKNAKRPLQIPSLLQPWIADMMTSRGLFPGSHRAKHNAGWLRRQCKTMCKHAGISEFGPQNLRASHSTLAQEAGATGQLVAASLGHGDVSTTYRHYTADGTRESAQIKRVMGTLNPGVKS